MDKTKILRVATLGLMAMTLVTVTMVLCSDVRVSPNIALVADEQGPIGPATSRFVRTVVDAASTRDARITVLRIDTPGGLSDSMREIIKTILGSPIPVATFLAPSGARAVSAGTYIAYASHITAMAPETNLGAATPIKVGGGLPLPRRNPPQLPTQQPDSATDDPPEEQPLGNRDPAELESINDAAAYIRALAELRQHSVKWAERAVRHAESLPATEALARGVIDIMADDVDERLAQIDGRTVDVGGTKEVLATTGLSVEQDQPSWQTQLLQVFTNPNVAFILLMIGFNSLVFGFSNPGTIGPGVIGVICLLLALYSLNMLPLNLTGLALVVTGVAFMVTEAITPAFGILGFGGLIAFVFGASLSLDSESPHFRLSWKMIAATGIASATLLVLGYALKAQRRRVTTSDAACNTTWAQRQRRIAIPNAMNRTFEQEESP